MATKNSEYEGAFIVERKDIDRLRQNKENNGYMIKPAITKDTYEYGYNHFKTFVFKFVLMRHSDIYLTISQLFD